MLKTNVFPDRTRVLVYGEEEGESCPYSTKPTMSKIEKISPQFVHSVSTGKVWKEKRGTHLKKKNFLFIVIRSLISMGFPNYTMTGEEIPEEPVVLVGNHAQIYGPLVCEFYFPKRTFSWCAGQMMHLKEVPDYAFQDFWSQKPKYTHFFYRILSHLIAPLSVLLFNHARTVPVYRDNRIMTTFKESLRILKEGGSLVIFPEYDQKKNHILYDFQERFIDIAGMYRKKTGKNLSFVPFYVAPDLKTVVIGKPVSFSSENSREEERERIRQYLMNEIQGLAEKLPVHRVTPYRNIPQKEYPYNKKEDIL